MQSKTREVGLFDAKTHLSRLVGRAERGEEIIITRRGSAVARLVPPEGLQPRDPKAAAAKIRQLRNGLKLKGATVRDLIQEGRA